MFACFPLRGQTGRPTCIMTDFLAKTLFCYCFFLCVCSRNHSPAQQKVPINERCFIKVGSSPWRWQAPLGPVVEIDCNLTKRLWAPDCTHAKVWLGGHGARAGVWAALTLKKVIQECKCPLLFPPTPAPLVQFFLFFNQSSRLRPDPPSPGLSSPHRSFPPSVSRLPSLIDVRFSSLVSLSFRSPQTYSRSSVSRFLLACADGSLRHFSLVFWRGIHLLLSVYPQTVNVCDSFLYTLLGNVQGLCFSYLSPHGEAKSRPFRCVPHGTLCWEKICTVVNGERQIIF